MSKSNDQLNPLPDEVAADPAARQWFDQIADRFEAAWRKVRDEAAECCPLSPRAGAEPPRLEDFVPEPNTPRGAALLQALIGLDIDYRRLHGEAPQPEDYLNRFPSLDRAWLMRELPPPGDAARSAPIHRGDAPQLRPVSDRAAPPLRIRCPHCQVVIEVVDVAPESDVTCPSCGSRFERALASTLKLSPEEMAKLAESDHGTSGPVEVPLPAAIAAQPAEPVAPPKRMFGRYELQTQLGQGAFGTVWKALDTEDQRLVALKLLRSQAEIKPGEEAAAREARTRFEREARTLSKIEHPGIVRLYKFGVIDDRLYLASELIDGGDLQKLLKNMRADKQSLTFEQIAQLCHQVAEALSAAHEAGIVHRDLKPANILLARCDPIHARSDPIHEVDHHRPDESGHYKPFIADFGLAKRDDRAEYTLTQAQELLGTRNYMAPEQWVNPHQVGPASDIYSLGAMLYELLTGRVPFLGTTMAKLPLLREQVLRDDPIAPRKLRSDVPAELETLCLKCLEKDPSRRFPTAAALTHELHRFLHSEPIHSRPHTRWELAWKWCQRNPAFAVSIALGQSTFVLLVVLVAQLGFMETIGTFVTLAGTTAFAIFLQRTGTMLQRSIRSTTDSVIVVLSTLFTFAALGFVAWAGSILVTGHDVPLRSFMVCAGFLALQVLGGAFRDQNGNDGPSAK